MHKAPDVTQATAGMPNPNLRFSSPMEYSRALRNAHDATISGSPHPSIAPALVASWRRSLALGINPDHHSPQHLHEVAEARSLSAGHRLAPIIPALAQLLADESASGRHLLIVADGKGEILWRVGSRTTLQMADALEFVEGADWSESGVGTNAIGQVLVTGGPAQLFSAEHLVRSHHEWACTASPIRDPLSGEILGVLDVSGPLESVTPDSLRMVRCGVRLAEELLKNTRRPATANWPETASGPDTVRRPETANWPGTTRRATAHRPPPEATISLELLGERPGAVLDSGIRIPLTLRRAEVLALLISRTQGWSADELAYQLHGDKGVPAAVRTEMHRVRSMLGTVLESNPYRFADSVRVISDVERVTRYLRSGRIDEALSVYPAPLLERSATLAIELMRDELNEAVGASVRASGNAELIARWCSTDMGSVDAAAATELAKLTGPGDARYILVRARMERMDRELRA